MVEVCRVWGAFVECGIRPFAVVEDDPLIDDPLGLKAVGYVVQIHSLLLQRPPEPFDEDIVQIPAAPLH